MVREGSRREGRWKYKEKQNMHKRGTGDQKREREKLSEMYVYTRIFL